MLHLLGSPRMDIEVIVRDNCSTDDTVESLRGIEDDRLKVHVAPENQGTINFFEISKLASGDIVTWLSDEDDFQFTELDYVLSRFDENPTCNVMFGSIAVGANGHLMFAETRSSRILFGRWVGALGCSGAAVISSSAPARRWPPRTRSTCVTRMMRIHFGTITRSASLQAAA